MQTTGSPRLRPRLRAVAGFVLPGLPAADVCCDHARLALALVASGKVPSAIASDVAARPLEVAQANIRASGLTDVHLRRGYGLRTLAPGEVASVAIAGVGASLAQRLLTDAADRGHLRGVARLVLQVNHGFPRLGILRAFIVDRLRWGLVRERVVFDDARPYVVIACEPEDGAGIADEVDRELGPLLRGQHDPQVDRWLRVELDRAEANMRSRTRARPPQDDPQLSRWAALLTAELARRRGRSP